MHYCTQSDRRGVCSFNSLLPASSVCVLGIKQQQSEVKMLKPLTDFNLRRQQLKLVLSLKHL